MEGAPRRRKLLGGADKRSKWILIAMFVFGAVLILVDAALIVGTWGQPPGLAWAKWFSAPTPVPIPAIQVSPVEGIPGVTITVVGQGWKAGEFLELQLSDPADICPSESVLTTNAGPEGWFRDELAFPPEGCWAGPKNVLLIARSTATGAFAAAEFRVLALPQTPTPTLTAAVEPTPTMTDTAVPLPTATPVVEPTAIEPTATATLVVPTAAVPTATTTSVPWPSSTPTVEIVDWRGEYFDNVNLMGTPLLVRNDTAINFDWQSNAPAMGLIPVDGFSARWTRAAYFDAGFYRFQAVIDDGLRLYVDGDLVIDQWRDGGRREVALDWQMTAGWHTLRVEYYERSGVAIAQVRWDKVVYYAQWKGEYWPNLSLQGSPTVVRNDAGPNGTLGLDFDWGQGSPGGTLPADGFSARWTRQVALDAGTYRFSVLVDDGVRLWLNDRLIVDAWSDHNAQELKTDWTLTKGIYTLKVEYYERIGNARIRVRWERVNAPTFSDWKGEYWPNRSLSGEVSLLRNDAAPNGAVGISFDWGSGSPSPGLPADGFSARWTRQVNFEAATYRFHALADDGIRLWVDGQLLIDKWRDQHPTEYTADRTMVRGEHSLKVEYYEDTGGARVGVYWEVVPASYPDWRAEYWSNRELNGSPVLVRNESGIDFNWGNGSPASGLPADSFSARWTRQVSLTPGVYRFYAWADDGVRVALNDRWIINEWHEARDEVYSAELPLAEAANQVKVEFYEHKGDAGVRVWWKRLGDLPSPAPAPKVHFNSAIYTVDEGARTATIDVVLSATSDRAVTVDYARVGGTATPGSDFGALGGRLTFDPGVTRRAFAVSIVDDTLQEPDETVVLSLSNPSNAQLGAVYQAVLTLVDNDTLVPVPEARFSAPTYSVGEGAGSATITVLLSAPSDRTVTVGYATAPGSANVGSDYLAAEGTLTFLPGVVSRAFTVTIVDDALGEGDETVALALRNPVDVQLGTPQQAVLTIVDDDTVLPASPSVQINELLAVPGLTDWNRDGAVNALDEWVELYNAGPTAADLGGWKLADDEAGSVPYLFPASFALEPGAFVVLYRRDTDVRLEDGGGTLRLLDASERVVDAVTYGPLESDTSYGRTETGDWYVNVLPSPGAPNVAPIGSLKEVL